MMLSRRLPHSKDELPKQFARIHMDRVIWALGMPLFVDSALTWYQIWLEDDFIFVRRQDGFVLGTTNLDDPEKAIYMMNRLHV